MTPLPNISILVATFNCAPALDKFLKSYSIQDRTRCELLIADGGSTDGTVDLLNQHQSSLISWSKSRPDKGIYDGLNSAIKASSGDWILVLGADDQFPKSDTLQVLVCQLLTVPDDVSICYGDIEIEHRGIHFLKEYPDYETFCKKFGSCPPIHHQSVLVRRKAILDAAGFDTRYRIHADYDLISRIPKLAPPIKLQCVITRFSDEGMSGSPKNIISSLREFWTIRRRLGLNPIEGGWKKRYCVQLIKVILQLSLPQRGYDWILAMNRGPQKFK